MLRIELLKCPMETGGTSVRATVLCEYEVYMHVIYKHERMNNQSNAMIFVSMAQV